MAWITFSVFMVLGTSFVLLAVLIEVRPNFLFLRYSRSYHCLLKSCQIKSGYEQSFRSEFQVELLDPDAPEPRKRMATYAAHGVQTKNEGSYYSHRRAKKECERYEPGRKYNCWVLNEPSITAMSRKTCWWISSSFGLFGALVIFICLLWLVGLITIRV